jgi:hypothetical protein
MYKYYILYCTDASSRMRIRDKVPPPHQCWPKTNTKLADTKLSLKLHSQTLQMWHDGRHAGVGAGCTKLPHGRDLRPAETALFLPSRRAMALVSGEAQGVPSALQSSHKKLLMASGLVKVPFSFVLPVSCDHRSVKGAMLKELLTIELVEVCHNSL